MPFAESEELLRIERAQALKRELAGLKRAGWLVVAAVLVGCGAAMMLV